MSDNIKFALLNSKVEKLYQENKSTLLFHGWHHITFVMRKAIEFSDAIQAETDIVKAAAITHDLNYIVKPNSEPEEAKPLRSQLLSESGYSPTEIQRIESIVMEAHTGTRGAQISEEGKALSDADTLFKSLPTTPILFASKYITQNKVDIYKLAEKVTSEQNPLMEQDIYFYTDVAKKKYLSWAKANLQVWNYVKDSFNDPDVQEMLDTAKAAGIL